MEKIKKIYEIRFQMDVMDLKVAIKRINCS